MGIIIRQSIKGTLVSYTGALIGFLNIVILFPLFLTTEEIGLYRVLMDAASFFVIFSLLGTTESMIKFFPHFKDQSKKHNGFLSYALHVVLLGLVVCGVIYFVMQEEILAKFSENSPLLLDYSSYILPLTFLIAFYNLFSAYCRSLLRIVIPKVIREFLIRLLLAVGTFLYFMDFITFQEFIVLIIGIYALALTLLIGYVYKLGHLFVKPDYTVFKSRIMKEISTFSLVTILGAGSGVIVSKIDTLMLGSMSGLESAGIYSIAFYIGAIIQMPRRNVADISTPIVAQAFESNNMSKVKEIYQKTSLNLLLVGAFLFTGLWTNIDSLFELIPNSEQFVAGKNVVLFIGLAKLIDMAFGINHEILTNSKYFRWNLLFLPLLAVTTVVANLYFIPKFGIVGAAMASFISLTLINVMRFFFLLFVMGLHPITKNSVKALFICGVAFYVGLILPVIDNIYLDILLRGMVVTTVYLILILLLKPSEDIDKFIKNYWTKFTSGQNQ